MSASEAIKNVTVAFPGAPAKIWTDERGEQKFVLSGIAFRRGTGGYFLSSIPLGHSGLGFKRSVIGFSAIVTSIAHEFEV